MKSKQPLGMTDSDLCDLWIGSFRYYLGRMTISVHSFCASLVKNWDNIPERAKFVIKKDLLEAIQCDDIDRHHEIYTGQLCDRKELGHDCDSYKWRDVYNKISEVNNE